MISEVIFTGTELLLGQILNTNAQYLQQTLAALGIDLYYQVTVGDNKKRLKEAILQASSRSDLVIVAGGLGPTEDDLSREALAEALNLPLVENAEARRITERFFRSRGVHMPENNIRQTLAPESGIILDNPVGTAPGLALDHNSVLYVLIPGPPGEFKTMLQDQVVPLLKTRLGPDIAVIKSRVLKLCGIGEGKVDEILGGLLHGKNPTLAPTAKFAEVHLRITAKAAGHSEADRMIDGLNRSIKDLLGNYIYGTDSETLPEVVGKMLAAKGLTLATAETCSGGYLSHLITSFPDGAQSLKLAIVTGATGMGEIIKEPSPPGELPAPKLAAGVRRLAGADIGIAVTDGKGKLYPSGQDGIIIAVSFGDNTLVREVKLWGEGAELRQRAVQVCLTLLWKTLKKI